MLSDGAKVAPIEKYKHLPHTDVSRAMVEA